MDHTGGRPEDLNCSYPMDTTLGVNYSKPSVDSDIGHKILLVNTERLSESFLVWKNLIKEDFPLLQDNGEKSRLGSVMLGDVRTISVLSFKPMLFILSFFLTLLFFSPSSIVYFTFIIVLKDHILCIV